MTLLEFLLIQSQSGGSGPGFGSHRSDQNVRPLRILGMMMHHLMVLL